MLGLALIAAILVGMALGLMAVGLAGQAARARAGRIDLARALDLIPMPATLERRWASPSTARELRLAGSSIEPRAYAAGRWFVLVCAFVIGAAVVIGRHGELLGQFLTAVILMLATFGPGIWLRWRTDRRRMEIDLSLPDFLDRLALGLEAGLGFDVALRRTGRDFRGLLGDEIRRLVRQIDRGHPRAAALAALAADHPSEDLHSFAAAVQQSERLGTSLAETLHVQTGLLRARRRRRAQEASRRLPILIVFPLVFFFLPALLIIYLAPPLLHLFLGR